MSFSYEFARSAADQFGALPVQVQEELLDLLDELCDLSEPRLVTRIGPPCNEDFTMLIRGQKHYVFPFLELDRRARKLIIRAVGHHKR